MEQSDSCLKKKKKPHLQDFFYDKNKIGIFGYVLLRDLLSKYDFVVYYGK